MKLRGKWHDILWFLVLLGILAGMLALAFRGSMSQLIHPKMFPFLSFAFGMIGILAFVQGVRLRSERKRAFNVGVFLFLIPLLLGVIYYPTDISQALSYNKTLSFQPLPLSGENETAQIDEIASQEERDAEAFSNMMRISYTELDEIQGDSVELVGFLHYDPSIMREGELLLSRMIMVCCAADAQLAGFLIMVEDLGDLAVGDWVRVRGVISKRTLPHVLEGQRKKVALIQVQEIERVKEPKNIYIYP